MKHSAKYAEAGSITSYDGKTLKYTPKFTDIYPSINSALDLSIGYTSSPSWRNLKALTLKTGTPVAGSQSSSTSLILETTDINPVLTLGYSKDVGTAGTYQIGYGSGKTSLTDKSAKNIRFYKNIDLKDLIFYFGTISCLNRTTRGVETISLIDVINMEDDAIGNYVVANWIDGFLGRPSCFYLDSETHKYKNFADAQLDIPKLSSLFSGTKIGGVYAYWGSGGNPLGFLEVTSINIVKSNTGQYKDWCTRDYTMWSNTSLFDFDIKDTKSATGVGYMAIVPNGMPSTINITDFVDKDQWYVKSFSTDVVGVLSKSTITNTSAQIYISPTLSYVKKLLAGCCLFVTDLANIPTATKPDGSDYASIDELIINGHIWCGEMVGGTGTDRWIHEVKDIYSSENLEASTENTKFDPEPITPEGEDKDDIESVPFGYYSTACVGTLWKVKGGALGLSSLTAWLMTQSESIDILNCILSVKEVPVDISKFNYGVSSEANITIAGHDTGVKGYEVSLATDKPTLKLVFGEFDVPRLSGTFLDFSPYSRYEMVLPFAPSPVMLPDWVAGKKITVYLMRDIITCSCQYIIECNGERICSVSGNFGIDKALSAQNVAVRDATRLQAQISTASSVIGGVMSGAMGNAGGVVSGALGGVSALTQWFNAGKNNYMYTIGANGDTSSVGLYRTAHLKITRTLSCEDDGYNHSFGRPLGQKRQIKSVSGFTVCENVDISGLSATEDEKLMIKTILESGVYL